jgi:hypothetical protein
VVKCKSHICSCCVSVDWGRGNCWWFEKRRGLTGLGASVSLYHLLSCNTNQLQPTPTNSNQLQPTPTNSDQLRPTPPLYLTPARSLLQCLLSMYLSIRAKHSVQSVLSVLHGLFFVMHVVHFLQWHVSTPSKASACLAL